jgi:aspartate carbamoyltransferase catalytic subunit
MMTFDPFHRSREYVSIRSAGDFNLNTINEIFSYSMNYIAKHDLAIDPSNVPLVYLCFEEPSTRTKEAFHIAAMKLGIPTSNWDIPSSRVASGADLRDEINFLRSMGVNLCVARGANITQALSDVSMPYINAGDKIEHPTQALVDLFTIMSLKNTRLAEQLPRTTLTAIVPRNCLVRPVRSLVLLRNIVPSLEIRILTSSREVHDEFEAWVPVQMVQESDPVHLHSLLRDTDIAMILPAYNGAAMSVTSGFFLEPELLDRWAPRLKIMHPFPRTGRELPLTFDASEHNLYALQAKFAVPARVGLLKWLTG